MYGDVQLVAVRVLERQEFADAAAGFQRFEAQVASDPVFRVHDRRALLQVIQLPDNDLGVSFRAPPPIALPQTFAE